MPGTTPKLALRYPLATEAPDGAGQMFALATDIENALAQGSWSPGLTGTGSAIGGSGFADGTYFRLGAHWFLTGRIVFGSSASFGSAIAAINNLPNPLNESTMSGVGYLRNGSNDQPFMLTSAGTGAAAIKRIRDGNLAFAYDYGTPPQSSEFRFQLRGVSA